MTRLALALALLAGPVWAQGNCAPRALLIEKLISKYGEAMIGGGLQNGQSIFEVWVSKENGTWTILRTGANGRSCIMSTGTSWRDIEAVPEGLKG